MSTQGKESSCQISSTSLLARTAFDSNHYEFHFHLSPLFCVHFQERVSLRMIAFVPSLPSAGLTVLCMRGYTELRFLRGKQVVAGGENIFKKCALGRRIEMEA